MRALVVVSFGCGLACDPKKPACPEDQRCVKDGDAHVCRPINDGVDL